VRKVQRHDQHILGRRYRDELFHAVNYTKLTTELTTNRKCTGNTRQTNRRPVTVCLSRKDCDLWNHDLQL